MVSFGEQNYQTGQWDHHCGGAIISKNAIATASHCFFSNSKGYNILTKIRTGDQNFADNTDDDFVEVYDIATIIKHPEYRGFGAKHDLAIVFTKQEIDFNVTTIPAVFLYPALMILFGLPIQITQLGLVGMDTTMTI